MIPFIVAGLALLGLSGCTGNSDTAPVDDTPNPDTDVDTDISLNPACVDADGDTYVDEACPDDELNILLKRSSPPLHGGDCNDANPAINPAAIEIPDNGVDENCDPSDDEVVDDTDTGTVDTDDTDTVGDTGDSGDTDTALIGDDTDTDETGETDTGDTDIVHPDYSNVDVDGDLYLDITSLTPDQLAEYEASGSIENAYGQMVALSGDCDDINASVNPGVSEIAYDGVDNDCAEGDLMDVDGDGHIPEAFGGDDHDDNDPLAYAGAIEIPYDGIDQDGDGEDLIDVDRDGVAALVAGGIDPDDNNPSIWRTVSLYQDADHDGYTVGTMQLLDVGDIPDELTEVSLGDDCNDLDASINPAATEEPYTGIDEDCSIATPDDDLDVDGYGVIDDCNESNPAIHPRATEIVGDDIDQDCSGADLTRCDVLTGIRFDGAPAIINMENQGDSANGYLLVHVGNIDEDPTNELIVGTRGYHALGTGQGKLYTFNDPARQLAAGATTLANAADVQIYGAGPGWTVSGALETYDADGDGVEELYFGVNGKNSVVRIDASAPLNARLDSLVDFTGQRILDPRVREVIKGPQGQGLGQLLINVGDIDGDGVDDMLVRGTSGYCGIMPLEDNPGFIDYEGIRTHRITGAYGDSQACQENATSAGDIDGDGDSDLVLGGVSDDLNTQAGHGWIVRGSPTLPEDIHLPIYSDASNLNQIQWRGNLLTDRMGRATVVKDLDGDGYSDVVVGGYSADNGLIDAGAIPVIKGIELANLWPNPDLGEDPLSGTLIDGDVITTGFSGPSFDSDYDMSIFDDALMTCGDRENAQLSDGGNDAWSDPQCPGIGLLAAGAAAYDLVMDGKVFVTPYARMASTIEAGGREVIASTVNGDQVFDGPTNGNLGAKVLLADINGDNIPDLISTAPGYDSQRGRVYVWYGREERTQ